MLSDCIKRKKSDNIRYVKSAKVREDAAAHPSVCSVSYKPVPVDLSQLPPIPPALAEALAAELDNLFAKLFYPVGGGVHASAVCASTDQNSGSFHVGGRVDGLGDVGSDRKSFCIPFTSHGEFVLPAKRSYFDLGSVS